MIVQIYEIQSSEEAEKCIELGVDHVGSVLLGSEQWKQPGIKEAVSLARRSGARSTLIPLFQGLDLLCRVLEYYQSDLIHFCENLTTDEGRQIDLAPFLKLQLELKKRFPHIKIIRSIPIPRNNFRVEFPTLNIAAFMEPASDFFLTDTWLGKEPVQGFIGITGKRCKAELAKKLVAQSSIPVILAGGLSPENVYGALSEIRPAGADSCTLTNATDEWGRPLRFRKDFQRVKRFVAEVRRFQKEQLEKAKT